VIRVRAALDRIPNYVPGKSAESVASEHALERAIKLASNEVPYPPTPAVLAAIAEAAATSHRYPDDNSAELRAALAARHGFRDDEVIVAGGSVTMVGQFILATCDAGDEVLYSWPSFEAYPILALQVGATACTAPLLDETYDLDAMADLVTERTRCIFVCSPNNPTSTAVRHDAVEQFLARVPPDCLVVVDEAYREFVTGPDCVDGIALLRAHDNVVVLRTFSKAYSLAGLRIGYAFGRADVLAALRKVRPPFPVSGVAQAAALAALDDVEENRRRAGEIVAERARVTRALRAAGYAVPDSEANFVWLPVLDGAVALGAFCEARGVVLRTFAGVGVRATIGSPDENARLLEVLAEAAAEHVVAPATV
jgi:histidinol-phosphate aminotransferase